MAWPLSVRVRLHRQQSRAKTRQNMRKNAQICLREPFLMLIWEIVWCYLLLFVTFLGFDLDEKGKFLGICLEESHPPERTFGGQMQPLERTFARFAAPAKPTFRLISLGFSDPAAKTGDNPANAVYCRTSEVRINSSTLLKSSSNGHRPLAKYASAMTPSGSRSPES